METGKRYNDCVPLKIALESVLREVEERMQRAALSAEMPAVLRWKLEDEE